MTRVFASVAIGGTKCSVAIASVVEGGIEWLGRADFSTTASPQDVLDRLGTSLVRLLDATDDVVLERIGVVCGGPLEESLGLVCTPPNLPRWNRVDAVTPFRDRFGVPVRLMNDANAGVLAEWTWGAAREANHAAFLTMGTGLGAGLLLNERLYVGATGLAGELGHWRLADSGPHGYGKDGSFEGFCSGAGIAKAAQQVALRNLQEGSHTELSSNWMDLVDISAQQLARAADDGDPVALAMWSDVGQRLGQGLALLIDLLNLEVIILGGIFFRQHQRLVEPMREVLKREALSEALDACRIEPSGLGEAISDYSGLVAALVGDETTSTGRQLSRATPEAPRPNQDRKDLTTKAQS
ncbi:MAG: ROK family protein [Acidimicrobiales bacterium]